MLLSAILALSQVSVTFTHPLAPLRELLPALTETTGRRLDAAKDMQWHLLYVKVDKVPVDELLGQVAKATYGKWETDNEGRMTLVFNRGLYDRNLAKEKALRERGIAQALKKALEQEQLGDYGHSALMFLNRIGSRNLSNAGPNSRRVYAQQPNRMQLTLPSFESSWIEALILRQNKNAARMLSVPRTPDSPETDKTKGMLDPEFWRITELIKEKTKPKLITSRPAMVTFAVNSSHFYLHGVLKLLDANGSTLASDEYELDFSEELDPEESEDEEKLRAKTDPPLKLSNETLQVIDYFADEDRSRKALAARVRDSAKGDPFQQAFAEIIEQYGKLKPSNLVLSVSEREAEYLDEPTLGAVEYWLEVSADLEEKDGWLVAVPREPPISTNREELSAAINRFRDKKLFTLEERAWLAVNHCLSSPAPISLLREHWISELYEWPTGHTWDLLEIPMTGEPEVLLRAYGRLSPTYQSRLRQGDTISYKTLAPDSRSEIERWSFDEEMMSSTFQESSPGFDFDYLSEVKSRLRAIEQGLAFMDEPTFMAPDGYLPQGQFGLVITNTSLYRLPKEPLGSSALTYLFEGPGVRSEWLIYALTHMANLEIPFPTEFLQLKAEAARFTVEARPSWGLSEEYEIAVSEDRKLVKFENLGESFHQALATQLRLEKQWRDYNTAAGRETRGRGSPPPTR